MQIIEVLLTMGDFEVTYRKNTTWRGYDVKDLEADHFACVLLMPRDLFIEEYNKGLSVRELSLRFEVPMGAVCMRISQLGLED